MSAGACGKRPYGSRYEARQALLILWKKPKRYRRHEMASYYCCVCQAWHLTSKRRRDP